LSKKRKKLLSLPNGSNLTGYIDSHPLIDPTSKKKKPSQSKRQPDKDDVGKLYEVRFDGSDITSFYENRAVLPMAAVWNMDEFLMVYIATAIEYLLTGTTDWKEIRDANGKRADKQLRKIASLCRKHVDAVRNFNDPGLAASQALRMLADLGPAHLWD